MDTVLTLLPILGVLVVGIVSPGPSFILVARTPVAISRLAALASALGMATGAALLATAALLGQLPIAVILLEAGWYTIVALALSAPGTRNAYLRQKLVVDRVAGSLLVPIGLELLFMVH